MNEIIKEVAQKELTGLKSGTGDHCFLPIWMVVVDEVIYARSWGQKRGWYEIFQEKPEGSIAVKSGQYKVKVELIDDSDKVNDQIDQAYEKKYNKAEYKKYVDDLKNPFSRVTTVRLILEDEI